MNEVTKVQELCRETEFFRFLFLPQRFAKILRKQVCRSGSVGKEPQRNLVHPYCGFVIQKKIFFLLYPAYCACTLKKNRHPPDDSTYKSAVILLMPRE
jgi:hypothetical protein